MFSTSERQRRWRSSTCAINPSATCVHWQRIISTRNMLHLINVYIYIHIYSHTHIYTCTCMHVCHFKTLLVITANSIFVNVSSGKCEVETVTHNPHKSLPRTVHSTGFHHPKHWKKLCVTGKRKRTGACLPYPYCVTSERIFSHTILIPLEPWKSTGCHSSTA